MPEKEAIDAALTDPICCVMLSISLWFIVGMLIIAFSKKAADGVEGIISKVEKINNRKE